MTSRLETFATGALAATAIAVAITFAYKTFQTPRQAHETAAHSTINDADWQAALELADEVSGSESSQLSMVVFSDFQCPYCKQFHESVVKQLQKRYPSQVRVLYLQFPLTYHPEALAAAQATDCVSSDSSLPGWYDLLFSHQDSLGKKSYDSFAQDAGVVELSRFRACIDRADSSRSLQRTQSLTERLKLPGTPSVGINKTLFAVAPTLSEIDSMLAVGALQVGSGKKQ